MAKPTRGLIASQALFAQDAQQPPFMPSDKPRPTRAPGTPVGQLLALQDTQGLPSQLRPRPTKRPASPMDCLRSPSDSYTSAASFSPSPTASAPSPPAKPRPSKVPHLRLSPGEDAPVESSCKFSPDFGQAIDFSFCHSFLQPLTDDSAVSQRLRRLKSRACAKLMVRSGLRCSLCFRIKSECICLQNCPPALITVVWDQLLYNCLRLPKILHMGQASRFRLGEPVFRFHASDSEASSPSIASSGFAQVLGDDFRFFPSEDEASPAASSDSLSSRPSRPGLRYRHPQPWVPIDIRPRYMYPAGLSAIAVSASTEARLPMIFQSLEGVLFGSHIANHPDSRSRTQCFGI